MQAQETDNDAKKNNNIQSYTYFTKVTYIIGSILQFFNTKSLVVQVSNINFNIQSLHL